VNNLLFGIPIQTLVLLIPLLPLFGAMINGTIAIFCRNGKRGTPKPLVNLVGVGMPLLAFAMTLLVFSLGNEPPTGFLTPPVWSWMSIGDFTANLAFKIDRLSLVMALVVTGVGSLIHLYSVGYMAHDRSYARYFAYLNLFLFSMLVLVLAGNLPLMFLGWEGVGACSYFLIGFWFNDSEKAAAGMKAFIVNRIGDFGFLLAIFLIYSRLSSLGVGGADGAASGLLSFDVLEQYKGDLFLYATPIALLLFVGATGKSAQIPLYIWLPDAMAGPTPVSALIHAATMVTAGVYMIARLHFIYTLSPVAMEVVAVIGIATAFFAALIALVQNDIKKILAYSTISQLGFMFFAVGVGAFAAAIFHLMTHAFFKACLFLGAGSVIHGMDGEQDIWKMGGLRKKMPITFWSFTASVLAIAGIFPFAGFFSKDAILWQGFATGHTILWGIGFVTAGLTAFYMSRLYALVFLGKARGGEKSIHAHESPVTMTIPLTILGLLAVVGGWVGVPECLKGSDRFFNWLAPLFPYEEFLAKLEMRGHGMELLLSIVTLLWVSHLGLSAVLLYAQKPTMIERFASKMRPLHRLLSNKFYVDEIYRFLFVRPVIWISKNILWKFMDEKVIDALAVEGTAETVGLAGRTLALMQNGVVQSYALIFAVGAILLIGYFTL
jgi:NADH-quinone oxidoreductase subunit L